MHSYALHVGLAKNSGIWQKEVWINPGCSKFTSVMPAHKSIGKKNYNAIKKNDQKYEPPVRHFEYLKNLGEIQATQVVAPLVNGMQGHAYCNDSLDVTYLPILLGYLSCYKQYMALLGYVVQTKEMGAFIVTGGGGGGLERR